MRIDKVHIKSRFKNLEDFEIDIDQNSMETVLIGLNATGKSNFMEALVVIFRDLDLERPPQLPKSKDPLEYYIKYECRSKEIEVEYSIKKGYSFKIEEEKLKNKSTFFKNKEIYLPKHVFIYYSGISDRVRDLYSEHEKAYYNDIKKKKATYEEFDSIRRIFLVQNIHASFALIAFFMKFDDGSNEQETLKFLKEELKIHDFASALFVIKKPTWARAKKDINQLWGAEGLVERFINDLVRFSLAPIYVEERIQTNYKKSETQNHLYLYLDNKQVLQDIVDIKYKNKIQLFNALESIHLSDLLYDVKIKVEKEDVKGGLSMNELSEGEKQLLTVLGLLKFTKDDETLILLDEPDTHLNPLWKWKYLDYLDQIVKRPETTQIIFCSHDPLVIGNLKKNQVQIFKRNSISGKTEATNPFISPREMSVSKILTSELFGIPSLMSKKLEDLLNEKRHLQAKLVHGELSENDRSIFEKLNNYFNRIGFNDNTVDSRYNRYLQLTSENENFVNRNYSKEEEEELDRIAKEVLEEILKEDAVKK
jgi:predicted ATPase